MKAITIKWKQICPRCGSNTISSFTHSDGYGYVAHYVKCSECNEEYPISKTYYGPGFIFEDTNDPRIESIKEIEVDENNCQ